MGFEGRKKGKYVGAEKFVEKMKKNTRGGKSSTGKGTRRHEEIY